jgi:hypothetical protein
MGRRRIWVASAWAILIAILGLQNARAVGWDSDDFIVTGAPNFPQYIGIFDHDFTFKGYLESNFLGVQGMDFDAAGNLVAIASLSSNPEVRVYSPSGARIGGFMSNNPALQYTGDLKVAPDGNYALGSHTNGVQVYTPQGTFVRQYGTDDSSGVTYVPGNRLWSGGAGTTVHIFDTITGAQIGTFTADQQTMSSSFQYSPVTNTVLDVDTDRDLGGVFERDLNGALLRRFHVPHAQVGIYSATRGPGGDVFGTHDLYGPLYPDLAQWSANGSVNDDKAIWPVQISTTRILWAGVAPEPGIAAVVCLVVGLAWSRPSRRNV